MNGHELPEQPYPGLRPFQKHEWPVYFGREPMTEAVLEMLATEQLVVVHGSSGCGKSSLVKAGALPRLEQEHSLHGVSWLTGQMRPGSSPLWNLAEAIARLVENLSDSESPSLDTTRSIRRMLNLGQPALARIEERYTLSRTGNVCLLIDQFEELFRYSRETSREEAQTFVEVLRGYDEHPPRRIYAIITMRSDHLGDCAQYTGFAELVNRTQYLLPRMDNNALMQAIREPARLFGGDVSTDLMLRLIDESQNEIDALPLVQHCLLRLWRQASKTGVDAGDNPQPTGAAPELTTEGYMGLQPLLSAHADEVLAKLTQILPAANYVAEHMFRAITEVDSEGRGIRRPLPRSELVSIIGIRIGVLDQLIEHFVDPDCSFLVRSTDQDPIIDISHEALIRCWTRLNDSEIDATERPTGWLHRELEDGRLWHALRVQARSGETISAPLVESRRTWFDALPGPAWADRYAGDWSEVEQLIERSQNESAAARAAHRAKLLADAESRSRDAMNERLATRMSVLWKDAAISIAVILLAYFGFMVGISNTSSPLAAEISALVGRDLPQLSRRDRSNTPQIDLRDYLEEQIRAGLVVVSDLPSGQLVTLGGDWLFASGSAELVASRLPLVQAIGDALDQAQGPVMVTGHTDSVPIRSFRFQSNWELSRARAFTVLQVLADRMSPARLTAAGVADTQPVASNDSSANRARNRRVEITLMAAASGQ